jgi:hypothetical protein
MKAINNFDKLSLIEAEAKGVELFNGKYTSSSLDKIPFYISADEFKLSPSEIKLFKELGSATAELFSVLGKLREDDPEYLFFRPDIILTEDGYKICEIELSPFGFPLAVFLEDAYNSIRKAEGKKLWSQNVLGKFANYWEKKTDSKDGQFIFSNHTKQFIGQFKFLSKKLRELGYQFKTTIIEDKLNVVTTPLYRCFYLFEKEMSELWDRKDKYIKLPSSTPFYETKMPLAVLTNDIEVRNRLSKRSLSVLDQMILPTWLIKEEKPPENFTIKLSNWLEIADLPKSKRKFVIKRVGNHPKSSWAKSVVFLHKISVLATQELITTVLSEPGEWIIQPFINSKKVTHNYYSPSDKKWIDMKGRVRLTPYYSFDTGDWLVGKATIRRNTLLIHGATDSINTLITW